MSIGNADLTGRAGRTACDPGVNQLIELRLGAWRREAPLSGMPCPTYQVIFRHVLMDLGEGSASISTAILELPANLGQGQSLPTHRSWRQRPMRITRNAPDLATRRCNVDIALAMTVAAGKSRNAATVLPSEHGRLVRMHVHSLGWPALHRVAVHATRMLQDFSGFREQCNGALPLSRDAAELGRGPQRTRLGSGRCTPSQGGGCEHRRQGWHEQKDTYHDALPFAEERSVNAGK
jgi:hypothetical protein